MLKIKEQTEIENLEIKTEEITFSSLLGKSEEMLKKEFYVYQIKKLFQKVSPLVCGDLEKEKIAKIEQDLTGVDVNSFAVTPFHLKDLCIKRKCDKNDQRELLIDFPNGEGSLSAKQAEIKSAIKCKLKGVLITLPQSVKSYVCNSVKGKLNKLIKKFKGEKSFVINDKVDEDSLKKLCKAIEMINGKIVINCLEDDSENLTPRINKIKDFIGEEKIKVIAKISTAEQLMGVLLTGVSGVYTPCAKEILTSFEEKFEVKIINE